MAQGGLISRLIAALSPPPPPPPQNPPPKPRRPFLNAENETTLRLRPYQRARFLDDHVFLHVHIPKAGGTTLTHGLADIVGWGQTLVRGHQSEVYAPLNLSEESRRATRLYSAHRRYGFHRHFPAIPLYVSSVRDPVARYASHHAFVARHPTHPSYGDAAGLSLAEAFARDAEAERPSLCNLQARRIFGGRGDPQFEFDDLIRHIEDNYLVIAPVSRVAEVAEMARRALDLPVWPVESRKAAVGGRHEIDPDVARGIAERNEMDLALVDWVETQFDAALARAYDRISDAARAYPAPEEDHAP